MPMYTEVLLTYGPDRQKSFTLRRFHQPRRYRLVGEAHRRWVQASRRLVRRIERPFHRRHARGCTGCTTAYDRAGHAVQVCGYMTLTMRQDLRSFALAQKGRGTYSRRDVGPEIARRHGWSATVIRDMCE